VVVSDQLLDISQSWLIAHLVAVRRADGNKQTAFLLLLFKHSFSSFHLGRGRLRPRHGALVLGLSKWGSPISLAGLFTGTGLLLSSSPDYSFEELGGSQQSELMLGAAG
jgi:hypothetical protein